MSTVLKLSILQVLFYTSSIVTAMIIKAPGYDDPSSKKSFNCTEAGLFPDVEDCQMFWFCEFKKDVDVETLTSELSQFAIDIRGYEDENPIDERNKLAASIFEPVRLFKCPEGYLFDENINFCQPLEKVKCVYPLNKKNEEKLLSPWGTMNDFR